MNVPFSWPESAVADLRKYRAEGLSCTQIAHRLSTQYRASISRNAVIGKCARMGIVMSDNAKSATFSLGSVERARKQPKTPKTPKEWVYADAIRERRAADLIRVSQAEKAAKVVQLPAKLQHPDEIAVARCCLEALALSSCRWPLERTAPNGETLFCANEKVMGRPYCEGHTKRAFQKSQSPEQKRAAQEELQRNRALAQAAGRSNSFFGFGASKRFA